jgi:hypothetical protein
MNRALLIVGLAVLAIAGIGAITYAANHALASEKTETGTVTESVRRVVVDVDRGDVKLVAAGDRVQIHRTLRYVVREPTVTHRVRDGVLTLRGNCATIGVLDCSTDFTVGLPPGVAAEVHSDVGDVEGAALEAPELRVSTNVGDVGLDLARPAAHVDAGSDVGDVDVAVPAGTYAVRAGADVGDREVGGLVQDDRAARTIRAGSDVGDVTVRAR